MKIILLIILFSLVAVASDFQQQSPTITKQGQLFTLRYVPGSGKVTVLTAGIPKIQFRKPVVRVRYGLGPTSPIPLRAVGDEFEAEVKPNGNEFTVEIEEPKSRKKETFSF